MFVLNKAYIVDRGAREKASAERRRLMEERVQAIAERNRVNAERLRTEVMRYQNDYRASREPYPHQQTKVEAILRSVGGRYDPITDQVYVGRFSFCAGDINSGRVTRADIIEQVTMFDPNFFINSRVKGPPRYGL